MTFFHDLLKVSMTLGFAVTFEYFQNFRLDAVQQTPSLVSTKNACHLITYFYLTLSLLFPTSAVTNVSKHNLNFPRLPRTDNEIL